MRILVYPLIGAKNISGESNFLYWKKRIEENPHNYYYMVLPKAAVSEGRRVFDSKSNINILEEDCDIDFFQNEVVIGNELTNFNIKNGNLLIDCVFTSKTAGVNSISGCLSDERRLFEVPIFNYEPGLLQLTEKFTTFNRTPRAKYKAYGLGTGHNIFLTNAEKKYGEKICKRYLSPASVMRFIKNSRVISPSFYFEKLDKLFKNAKENKKPILFFGGRMNKTKKIDTIFDIYDKYFAFGRDVDIVFTTSLSPSISKEVSKKNRGVKVISHCDKNNFLKEAAKGDVFLCASDYEGFPVGFFEIVYLGAVGIFPRKPWAESILGKDYPYFYDNYSEASAILRVVLDDLDKARENVKYIREKIKKYGIDGQKKFWNFVKEKSDYYTIYKKSSKFWILLESVIKEEIKDKKTISLSDILSKIEDRSDFIDFSVTPRVGIPSKWDTYKIIQRDFSHLLKDMCNSKDVIYKIL